MYLEWNEMHPRHPGSNKEVILYAGFHDLGAPGDLKNLSLGIPTSDLLGVNLALIHIAAQRFLAV